MAHLHPLLIRSPWNIFSSVQMKDDKRYLALAFTDLFQPSIICGWGVLTKKTVFLVWCTKRKNGNTQSGPKLWRAFKYGKETQHMLFCREISFVVSYACRRGSQKVMNDDKGGSQIVTHNTPLKLMTSFMNSPLVGCQYPVPYLRLDPCTLVVARSTLSAPPPAPCLRAVLEKPSLKPEFNTRIFWKTLQGGVRGG